jgi:ribosome-associated translation inhibitor RaiA
MPNLEIVFHEVSRSEWSERYIREHAERLERFCDHIISCSVTVEQPHRHQHKGKPYRVRVEVRIPPNKTLVAIEEPVQVHKDRESHLQPVIHAAFESIERQIKKLEGRRRRDLHTPAEQSGTRESADTTARAGTPSGQQDS